jgi:RNA polymerase sigma factor (sigma-70 family)
VASDDDSLDLARRCLDGHEDAQRELVRRYAGLCAHIASRILGDADRSYVEDAVQEAFYAIFARLGQWQGQNLAAWIGTIAARRAIDLRRRLRRSRAETTALDGAEPAATSRRHGEIDMADLRDALERARARMTLRQQHILDALLEGKPREQIARELGLSPRMVYYELAAIRGLLRESLERFADEGETGRL